MELTTWDGRSCRLPTLLSWTLTYTGGVPCDSMTICCPYDASMAEVLPDATRFAALRDGAVMLRGVVDAYEISLSGQGLLVTLEGRGMAALLMDNESEALTYGAATIGDILRNHVEPYGITVERGSSLSGDGYAVVSDSLTAFGAKVWFENANDQTCEGVCYPEINAFSVQFHPEACAGPKDTNMLFDRFASMLGIRK